MTRMEQSFDHLDIVNAVLSLAYNLESYPNHLYRVGYSISRIDPKITVNGELNPDVLFMAEERALFAECKSGECYTGENIDRYDQVTTRHLMERGVDIPVEVVILDVGIFGKDNLEALKEKLQEKGITYPQVIMNKFVQKKYGDNFKDPTLHTLFAEPVEIKGKPLMILRFTKESSLKEVAPYIFQALIARSASGRSEFKTRELTEELVGEVWETLDDELQRTLSNKVRLFLNRCKSQDLRFYLSKNQLQLNSNLNSSLRGA